MVPPGTQSCRVINGNAATQPVANRPIVCHVLDSLRSAGATEIAVVGAPDALGEIRKSVSDDGQSGDEVVYLALNGRRDFVGALTAAASFVEEAPCILHSATGVVGQPLAPFTELLEPDSADLILLLHRTIDPLDYMGPAMERLLGISQLNGSKSRLGLAGVCVFGPGVLQRPCLQTVEPDPDLDLTAIARQVARSGKRVQAEVVHTWRRYSGKPLELLELNRIVLDQQVADGDPLEGGDNRIEGRVVIHPTAEVTSSVILGPSIIGPNARVASSYIGPYTSIGAGARIEGAEIERSIVLAGARIMHISGRIEASTVGRRASIFRDFGLPRALRLHVGDDDEVALN